MKQEKKYDFDEEGRINPGRLFLLAAGITAVLAWYTGILYDTQVIHHEDYLSQSVRSIVRTETVHASRGIITDRNGVPLISNGFAYDMTFDPALLREDEDPNEAVLRLVQLCVSQDRRWNDRLPLSWGEPFSFTIDTATPEQKRLFLAYLLSLKESKNALGTYLLSHQDLVDTSDLVVEEEEEAEPEPVSWEDRIKSILRGGSSSDVPAITAGQLLDRLSYSVVTSQLLLDAGITPELLMGWMGRDFKVPEDYTVMQRRSVLGVRYEIALRSLGDNTVYIMTENVTTPFISLVSDGNYRGAKIINSSVREYETSSAPHILGTVGPLYKEDLENPLYEGYPLDATVGRSGVEAAFEEYLHGQDGRRVLSVTEEGKITGEYYTKEPQPGSTVELTIDLTFQQAVEEALAETLQSMKAADGDQSRGAGVAVVRVGTGEILALASYPSFDLTTYSQNYNDLLETPGNPLVNRATQGAYPPGSTLKPATAIAALESGTITLKTHIRDGGTWYYPNTNLYANCWYKPGHGSQTITQAITNSCNVFFAELGYRMGMDTLNEYYAQFGLGEHTGIETGDNAGNRPYNPRGENQAPWAAFGQSNQLYTPLQLANYIATIVSNGRHCKAHLLKSVKSYDNTTLIAQGDISPANMVEMAPGHVQAVKTGMKNLVDSSLSRYFDECVVSAGAKTGTAQIVKGVANNGVFICFAPYEEPEIAIGMVIERGGAGANLASTSVKILNAWFDREQDGVGTVTGENELLP